MKLCENRAQRKHNDKKMRKNMRYRLLLMLVLLSLAAGIHAQNIPSGVVINKTVTADATVPFKYNVTTEAYVTGKAESETQDVVTPSDVVLLIDNSDGTWCQTGTINFNDSKTFINNIIDAIYSNSTTSNVKHRISIVKFHSDVESVKSFTEVNESSISQLKSEINNMSDNGDGWNSSVCVTNDALNFGNSLFNTSGPGVKKIIVIFQSGRPCDSYGDNDFKSAITTANGLKQSGVDIYSLCFYNNSSSSSNVYNLFESISKGWTKITSKSTSISFTIDFTKAQNVKSDKPDYTLWTSTSTLKESFSTSLTLNNQTVNVQPAEASNLVTVQNEFISITGLDLSSKYWGTHWINGTATSSGQKLQLTYPLYFDASKSTSAAIPTSSSSGLYEGDSPLFMYSSPSITIPTLVISRTGLNVGESATFNVYKVTDGGETLVGQVSMTCTSKDAAATATLKVPETGTYRVRETTWGYSSSSGTDYVDKTCNSSSTFTYSFTGTKKANDAHHSEAQKTFSFN